MNDHIIIVVKREHYIRKLTHRYPSEKKQKTIGIELEVYALENPQ